MANQFSNEIYSMIVDNLQDEVSTLRRVSFVNRAFAASSRLYLWRRVTLRDQPASNHVSSCAEFYEILTRGALTPAVADLVQEFCIDSTEHPSTLSSDVHLPLVLDRLGHLTRLDIFNMFWPTDNNNPLFTSIRRILRSASLEGLTMVSLKRLALPTYLIHDCLAVRTLRLRGNYILENPLSVTTGQGVATRAPRPQNLILDLDPSIMADVWPRMDTSSLQSLVIQLPAFEDNMIIDGHTLQCLGLNYMEDGAEYPYPNFNSLANLKQLFIAFPTWLPAWPEGLADLLESLNPLMQNLEQVHLYLIVEPADTLVNEDDHDWHQPEDFQVLDSQLARLQSPRLFNIHIALCPNSDPVTNVRGGERVTAELSLTRARNILSVDVVAELPWQSMFRS